MGQGGFIVLINGTPYDWNLGDVGSYQMNSWNGSFPAMIRGGTFSVIYVEWDEGIFKNHSDDSGNAIYNVSQTNYSIKIEARGRPNFNIKVIYNNFSNLGSNTFNMGWVHDGRMPFTISGKPNRFIASGSFQGAYDWMRDNLSDFGDRTLKQLSIPGSHDSGMSVSMDGTAFASESNTKTQHYDYLKQLELGSRYFDLRPIIGGGQFFTGHYSKVGISFQGARGQSIQSIIDQINEFTTYHQELIILHLSHSFNTDLGNESYRSFNQGEWNNLFATLSRINNLFHSSNDGQIDLTAIPLRQFITGKSAVCIIVDDDGVDLGQYRHRGFFRRNEFPLYDQYSETSNLDTMVNDQTRKMGQEQNSYFLLSWTLTQEGAQTVLGPSIESLAGVANRSLHRLLPQNFYLGHAYPNIVHVDYIDTSVVAMVLLVNFFCQPK